MVSKLPPHGSNDRVKGREGRGKEAGSSRGRREEKADTPSSISPSLPAPESRSDQLELTSSHSSPPTEPRFTRSSLGLDFTVLQLGQRQLDRTSSAHRLLLRSSRTSSSFLTTAISTLSLFITTPLSILQEGEELVRSSSSCFGGLPEGTLMPFCFSLSSPGSVLSVPHSGVLLRTEGVPVGDLDHGESILSILDARSRS